MNIFAYYLFRNLILTVLIELLLALIIGIKSKKDIIIVILVNLFTNPLVTIIPFIFNIYCGIMYKKISLIILEILVVLLEGYIYKKSLNIKKLNPYLLSLILNISSYGVGLIINYLI